MCPSKKIIVLALMIHDNLNGSFSEMDTIKSMNAVSNIFKNTRNPI